MKIRKMMENGEWITVDPKRDWGMSDREFVERLIFENQRLRAELKDVRRGVNKPGSDIALSEEKRIFSWWPFTTFSVVMVNGLAKKAMGLASKMKISLAELVKKSLLFYLVCRDEVDNKKRIAVVNQSGEILGYLEL